MKKKKVNPLNLDKETIARLDEKQLEALAGGAKDPDEDDEATLCHKTCGNTVIIQEPSGEDSLEGDCCVTKN